MIGMKQAKLGALMASLVEVQADRLFHVGGDLAAARGSDWGWQFLSDGTLPPPLTDVLVCYWDDFDGEEMVTQGFRNEDGWFMTDTTTPRINEPVAWMPLPNPPRARPGVVS